MGALLFVYGSLRPDVDHEMSRWLAERSEVVGPATAQGTLLDLERYPGFHDGVGDVHGLLLRLHEVRDLTVLDAYEGVPGLFVRERRRVLGPDGPVEAWTYVYVGAKAGRPVPGGDWTARTEPS